MLFLALSLYITAHLVFTDHLELQFKNTVWKYLSVNWKVVPSVAEIAFVFSVFSQINTKSIHTHTSQAKDVRKSEVYWIKSTVNVLPKLPCFIKLNIIHGIKGPRKWIRKKNLCENEHLGFTVAHSICKPHWHLSTCIKKNSENSWQLNLQFNF